LEELKGVLDLPTLSKNETFDIQRILCLTFTSVELLLNDFETIVMLTSGIKRVYLPVSLQSSCWWCDGNRDNRAAFSFTGSHVFKNYKKYIYTGIVNYMLTW
jgi:hypothetical protein